MPPSIMHAAKKFVLLLPFLSALISFLPAARADSEAAPHPYVVSTKSGEHYFRMHPDPKSPYDREKGSGALYEVKAGEPDRLLWKTEGWYAFRVYVPNHIYLIRIGNWPRGTEPSQNHMAIAFYKNGELLKSYSTLELIKPKSRVPSTVSHYQFLKEVIGFNNSGGFKIKMIDGTEHEFEFSTGKKL